MLVVNEAGCAVRLHNRRVRPPGEKRAAGDSLTSVGLRPPSVSLPPRRHSHLDCRWPLILIVARQPLLTSACGLPAKVTMTSL
jgi:hypothetical protein